MAPEGRLRWAVDCARWSPSPPEFEYLLTLLPAEEAQQCTRFRQQDDQKRALVSRLLQRHAAAVALGLPHAEVACRRTRGGKPYVANQPLHKPHAPNWNYSVSHEGDYVILAAESVCICGCDVAAPQQVRRRQAQPLSDFFRSFDQQFTAHEWDSIRQAGDDAAQEAQFRRLWSLKEAFVKATGEGLGFKLGDAEFSINGSTASVSVKGVPQPGWAFHLHDLSKGHCASVARAPLAAVVDAWGGFTATFQKTTFTDGEWQEELHAPEPPFMVLSVSDLVPEAEHAAYEAAGGDML